MSMVNSRDIKIPVPKKQKKQSKTHYMYHPLLLQDCLGVSPAHKLSF